MSIRRSRFLAFTLMALRDLIGMGKLLERESILAKYSRKKLIDMNILLLDLDSLAGAVAYRHCLPKGKDTDPNKAPKDFHETSARAGLYLATASADRLDIFGRLNRENVR